MVVVPLPGENSLLSEKTGIALPEITQSASRPAYLKEIFTHAPFGIVVGGPTYCFTKVNRTICHLLGYKPSELIGRDFRFITHPDDISVTLKNYRSLVELGGTNTHEKRYVRKNGTFFWARVTTRILRQPDGVFLCSISMVEDITDQRHMQQTLRETTEALARSNEMLEHFATLAAHDLKQPLRGISQFLSLIETQNPKSLDAETSSRLAFVVENCRKLNDMVENLLSLAHVEVDLKREMTSLDTCLADALENLKLRVEETHAVITADPLPLVWAAPTQFTHVFQNLVDNSIKYRSDQPPRIHIACVEGPEEWQISVRDNGTGVPAGLAEKMFDLFTRLPADTSVVGHGIGLALCRRILDSHGGRIWGEPVPGGGYRVCFTLPRVRQ